MELNIEALQAEQKQLQDKYDMEKSNEISIQRNYEQACRELISGGTDQRAIRLRQQLDAVQARLVGIESLLREKKDYLKRLKDPQFVKAQKAYEDNLERLSLEEDTALKLVESTQKEYLVACQNLAQVRYDKFVLSFHPPR